MQALRAGLLILVAAVAGCDTLDQVMCAPHCRAQTRSSSSLVGFLYPDGKVPPPTDAVPQLPVPLRVGLAFLPPQSATGEAVLSAAQKEDLLERIRSRFSSRKFVSEIVEIPDYYLSGSRGFAGLEGVQRLYKVDVMALVSYDQVTNRDDNSWSLGYITIVGAYVLKGTRHDIATLVDLAVVDPATKSLVLRAGGIDTRHGSATLVDEARASRTADIASFSVATDQMIEHFDVALSQFERDVRAGKANVRVVARGGGGGGAFDLLSLIALLALSALCVERRRHAVTTS